jgi:hypothetical protein
MERLKYIRFGDIPKGERSTIWNVETKVGKERGVSVYDCLLENEEVKGIVLPIPITEQVLNTFLSIVKYDDRPCYLVEGDCVGRGSDGEPLLRNVEIVKQIKYK